MTIELRLVRGRVPLHFGVPSRIHPICYRNDYCCRIVAGRGRSKDNVTAPAQRWASTTTTTRTTTVPNLPQVLMERIHLDVDGIPKDGVSEAESDERPFITQITLNRPKANAMGIELIQKLRECLDRIEDPNDTSRCVVLTSSSHKVFSAGADLKERAKMSMKEASEFVSTLRMTMERVAMLPIPVIAAVEGVALGGGLELALAADIRIATTDATFGLPETSLAIIPGAGGTQRLPRLIGIAKAKELIWTGRRITGEEALSYGLVQHCVSPGEATGRAVDLAFKIAQNGPIAIRASKEAIQRGSQVTEMMDALEIERQCYEKVLTTRDRLEGLAAFKEGRNPQYRGH